MEHISINKLPAKPYTSARQAYDDYMTARLRHTALERDELRQELKAADVIIEELTASIATLLEQLENLES